MKWSQVGNVLGKLAPTIAGIAGGPFAATAVTAVESALKITPKDGASVSSRKDDCAVAIANATPEQMAEIQKAELDLKAKLAELNLEPEQLAVQDRESARQRQSSVKDLTPTVLAYLMVLAAIVIGALVLFGKLVADSATAGMIVGYLFSEAKAVSSYYFGGNPPEDTPTTK